MGELLESSPRGGEATQQLNESLMFDCLEFKPRSDNFPLCNILSCLLLLFLTRQLLSFLFVFFWCVCLCIFFFLQWER